MKFEKWHSGIIAALLAFCISFGGVMAMDTGFDIRSTEVAVVVLFCAVYSALAAWAFSCRRGDWILLCVTLLAGVLLWFRRVETVYIYGTQVHWESGPLQEQLTNLLNYIFRFYHTGYGWGTAPEGASAQNPMTLGLCLVAVPVIWAVCRTVCCRKWALSAVVVGFLPLISCLVVTDTVPDVWCLMVLIPAMLLLILTQNLRRSSAGNANRLTAILLVPAVLASALLFWAIPQEEYVPAHEELFTWFEELIGKESGDGPGSTPGGLPGGNNGSTSNVFTGPSAESRINLANVGLKTSPRNAMLDVIAPQSGILYLRGRSYEYYDGKSWDQLENPPKTQDLWPLSGSTIVGQVEITTKRVHPVLYFPYYAGGELWTAFTDGAIANPEALQSYSFQQYSMGQLPTEPDPVRIENCTRLPEHTAAEAKRILEENGISADSDPEQTVAAVAALVRTTARYNLQATPMPSEEEDFAIWFLEDATRGYCVHYATAAAVLLRAAGIPARYVTGYMTPVTAGEKTTVVANQGHAWVEYYRENVGWCVLDATPSDENEEPTEPSENTEPTDPSQITPPTRPSLPAETTQPSQTLPATPTQPEQPAAPSLNLRWLGRFAVALCWIAGILLAIWGQYFLRRRRKEGRMSTGDPNRRALSCWKEICLESRLQKQVPPEELRALAEKAKYSQHTLTDAELEQFRAWLQQAKQIRRSRGRLAALLQRLIWAVA